MTPAGNLWQRSTPTGHDRCMRTLDIGDRSFTVRRAAEADLPALVALLAGDPLGSTRESADDLGPYLAAFREIEADPHQLLVAVTEEDGPVVGTVQLSLIPGLSRGGATRLQIEAFRLAASTRGSGLGSALLEWAHEYGRGHGARLSQLTCDRTREDAHRFYQRAGYVASHTGFKQSL